MAALRQKHGLVAVTCSSYVLYCNSGVYTGWTILEIPAVEESTESGGDQTENRIGSNGASRILASSFSPSGRYFALCDDQKRLHIYETGSEWKFLTTRKVVRRGKCIAFTSSEDHVLVADKSGDIYKFPLSSKLLDRPGELTHGHLSMVLDMVITRNDEFIATCDRDEKIRVSNYPNSYNIHSYCLGHTEFVTSLCYDLERNLLISGSGDLTLRTWTVDGEALSCTNTGAHTPTSIEPNNTNRPAIVKISYCAKHKHLACIFVNNPCVEVYDLRHGADKGGTMSLVHTVDLPTDPWDISYDEDGHLWILTRTEGSFLQIYHTQAQESGAIKIVKSTDVNDRLVAVQDDLSKELGKLHDQTEDIDVIHTLWKQKFDNVTDYLKRKEKRLAGKGDNADNILKPPEKLAKTT